MTKQLTENSVRKIVSEEISGVKEEVSGLKKEQKKQGILLEDLHAKLDKNIDLLTRQMDVKKRVDKHDERLDELEAGQKTIKAVVKLHAEQLAS